MKKTSMLVTTAMLLYGASSVYALPEITPDMLDQDVLEILDYYGVPYKDVSTDSVAEGSEGTESGPDGNVPDDAAGFPSYISVNDKNPVKVASMCGFQPTGAQMADFPVTATLVTGNDTATFKKFPLAGLDAGLAKGKGWFLFEKGDTWDATSSPPHGKWWLVTKTAMTSIKIDPLSKLGPVKYAFDIMKNNPEHTVGSKKGWYITQFTPLSPPVSFKATYSRPVLVADGHPSLLDTPHDLYGTLTIDFATPALGLATLPTFFTFRADTDCLPVQEVALNSYNGTTLNFTVVGEGAVSIMERAEDGVSLTAVQGPFTVDRGEGQKTFTTQFTPQSNFCYSMMDVDNLKVMTPEHCF